MKKLFIMLALAGMSLSSMAQDTDPVKKHSVATNSFWSNWFVQVGGNWNVWYSSQEHGLDLKTNPFSKDRGNFGAAVAVGKWFTPGLGLRVKAQGIWGKTVGGNYVPGAQLPYDKNTYFNRYWILNGHALFNVSNMLFGYNPNRVWNVIPFVGAGFGRTMTHNLYAMDLSGGLLNEFRLSKRVALNVEVGLNRLETDIDGTDVTNGHRGWDSHDNNFYGEIGLTFNLGKSTWERTPDVDAIKALSQSQIDALNAQLNDANAENARLKDLLANQKPAENTTIKEFITTPISVFFNLDKTNIASQKDLVNVAALAKYAKANNSNILVTGYADSATGKAPHNQWLSEERAKTVAHELVKLGINRDNISTVGKGGVDELSPVSFNRRATVQITE